MCYCEKRLKYLWLLGLVAAFPRQRKQKEKISSFLLSRRTPTVRSGAGFPHLISGLICPTALSKKAKVFSLPVPIAQDFLPQNLE